MDWTLILLAYILIACGTCLAPLIAECFRFFRPESKVKGSFIAAFGLFWPIVTLVHLGALIHLAFKSLARFCRKVGGR